MFFCWKLNSMVLLLGGCVIFQEVGNSFDHRILQDFYGNPRPVSVSNTFKSAILWVLQLSVFNSWRLQCFFDVMAESCIYCGQKSRKKKTLSIQTSKKHLYLFKFLCLVDLLRLVPLINNEIRFFWCALLP